MALGSGFTWLTGAREAPYEQLQWGLSQGDVTQVTVSRELPTSVDSGSAHVSVFWEESGRSYVTEVRQKLGNRGPDDVTSSADGQLPEVVGSVTEGLRTAAGTHAASVEWKAADRTTRVGKTIMGVVQQYHVGPLFTFGWIVALIMLVAGPEPRRATRWAWWWILYFGNIPGALAFLVLGEPREPEPPEGVQDRLPGESHPGATTQETRLTGGKSFLLSVFVVQIVGQWFSGG